MRLPTRRVCVRVNCHFRVRRCVPNSRCSRWPGPASDRILGLDERASKALWIGDAMDRRVVAAGAGDDYGAVIEHSAADGLLHLQAFCFTDVQLLSLIHI